MSTTPVRISNKEARRIILASQGLHKNNPFGAGSKAVVNAVEHLGYVQIDTISVVERAHHHVLWTRIPTYKPKWLDEAQWKSRKIFEYWSHAAAYLPMKDFRFSLPVMNIFRSKKDNWPKVDKKGLKQVMDRIRLDGPVMSRDFVSQHKGGTWWDWKPSKWALQRLFLEGELMVSHREGFQRVYDLTERVIPTDIDTSLPTAKEYYTFLIVSTLKAQGLAYRKELFHLRSINHHLFDSILDQLVEDGTIKPVIVEKGKPMYMLAEGLDKPIRIADRVSILSPFDNTVIWRNRMKDVFDFDYTLECYIPAAKRQYGYFCLPVLHKDEFIGRVDLKAERKKKELQVKKIHWRDDKQIEPEMFEEVLRRFAEFNGCETLVGWKI